MSPSKKKGSIVGRGVLLCCCFVLAISVWGVNAAVDFSEAGHGHDLSSQEEMEEGFVELDTAPPTLTPADTGSESTRLPDTESIALAPCEDIPLPPENGYITKGANTTSASGEVVVRVECEEGYVLNGPSSLTCLPEGSAVWIPDEEYFCSPSPEWDEVNARMFNAMIDGDRDDAVGDDTDDVTEATDTENVEIDKRDLYDVQCSKPTAPDNGQVIGSDVTMGSHVTYECDEGYILHGPQTATCLAVPDPFHHFAIWDPQVLPTCLPVDSAPPPPSLLVGQPHTWDTEGSQFKPPQRHVTAGRLTDSTPYSRQVEGLPSLCSLPPVTGPCRMVIPRFYFDSSHMECRPFNYGGCAGNSNNFDTFQECQDACR